MTLVHFFFNDTATTEIYTLSLHDALPICTGERRVLTRAQQGDGEQGAREPCAEERREQLIRVADLRDGRSEEHTSELQSQSNLVCRLLLGKKNLLFWGSRGLSFEDDRLRR